MTLTISAADLATVRQQSGDTVVDYDVSDVQIDAIYVDTAQGNLNLWRTAYYVAVRRYGIAVNQVSLSGEFGNAQHNQQFDQLERLIKFLGGMSGLGFGGITLGVNTVHAYRADSDQTEAPDYSNGAL